MPESAAVLVPIEEATAGQFSMARAVEQARAAQRAQQEVPSAWDEETDPRQSPKALCRTQDPELFFPEKGGSSREAKRICGGCVVRIECLNYALRRDERYGVWGGFSERERRRLKHSATS